MINNYEAIPDVVITLLTQRAVLGSGTVTLAVEVALNAVDVIGLFYTCMRLPENFPTDGAYGQIRKIVIS
ncbi:MAG: hypothetical protein ACE3K2_26900 [Paenibacillus sp.]|uniref:hypothetical protein n=1 Tax=Paenibacillus sp. TaxID=58172 RepID=UPI003B762D93